MNLDCFKARFINPQGTFDGYVDPFHGRFHVVKPESWDWGQVDLDDDSVLLRCTGLKDCNGTLIYEGDMVMCRVTEKTGICKFIPHGLGFGIDWQVGPPSERIDQFTARAITVLPTDRQPEE